MPRPPKPFIYEFPFESEEQHLIRGKLGKIEAESSSYTKYDGKDVFVWHLFEMKDREKLDCIFHVWATVGRVAWGVAPRFYGAVSDRSERLLVVEDSREWKAAEELSIEELINIGQAIGRMAVGGVVRHWNKEDIFRDKEGNARIGNFGSATFRPPTYAPPQKRSCLDKPPEVSDFVKIVRGFLGGDFHAQSMEEAIGALVRRAAKEAGDSTPGSIFESTPSDEGEDRGGFACDDEENMMFDDSYGGWFAFSLPGSPCLS